MKIADVIKRSPDCSKISLNKKIEELCGLLYATAKMLLQELHEKQAEIGIIDIKLANKKKEISNEGKAFFENIETFSDTFEYFRQCVDAFKIIIKREERNPLSLKAVEKLIYYVEKCRFLENNVEEEYRMYESSIDNASQLTKKKKYIEYLAKMTELINPQQNISKPQKTNVFTRLIKTTNPQDILDSPRKNFTEIAKKKQNYTEESMQNSPINSTENTEKRKKEIEKLFHEVSEEEKLNEYIQGCLHKILPVKTYITMGSSNIIHRMYAFPK